MTVGAIAGAALARRRAPWAKAVAAGIFYGLADASIKAVSPGLGRPRRIGVAVRVDGGRGDRDILWFSGVPGRPGPGRGVSAISLMNALAALVALACGLLAFGESLGGSAGGVVAHLVAIAVVLGCVPVLAAAQVAIVQSRRPTRSRPRPRARSLPAVQRPGVARHRARTPSPPAPARTRAYGRTARPRGGGCAPARRTPARRAAAATRATTNVERQPARGEVPASPTPARTPTSSQATSTRTSGCPSTPPAEAAAASRRSAGRCQTSPGSGARRATQSRRTAPRSRRAPRPPCRPPAALGASGRLRREPGPRRL